MVRKDTTSLLRAGNIFSAMALALALGASACGSDSPQTPDTGSGGSSGEGGGPSTPDPDPSDALFDPDHVIEVGITMAPEDWEQLRRQAREVSTLFGEGCMDGPKESPYTQFPATVTVDGTTFENSAVRKKGFLGSASRSKPSLKISFDEYVDGRELAGLAGLTLNNSRQDPSLLKTCLAFKVFRDAGLPASRCSFAHVTVNGEDLGVYAHVEPVNKRLLKRHFQDASGDLYEGQISDFREGWTATYEKKTNKDDPDRSELDAVAAALLASDAELDAKLGAVLDIEAFRRYWATESLLAAWDGYAGNTNNHHVYFDPTSGKMYFLPWGPDMSFDSVDPLGAPDRPQSVSARGAVAERLYKTPELRAAYAEAMKDLLETVWKEDALLREIDRMEELLAPYVGANAEVAQRATDAIRGFVRGRRATITAELEPTPPEWTSPAPDSACMTEVGTLKGTFSTTWGSLAQMDTFATGTGTLDAAIPADDLQSAEAVGVAAGNDVSEPGLEFVMDGRAQLMVVGAFPDGKVRAIMFYVDPEVFADGGEGPFDWQSVFALALDLSEPEPVVTGLFGGGKIRFDEASMEPGAPVTGSFEATLLGGGFF
ncbi:CotH kinase family protein [Sorangium sp. So ce1024]|uniref:CotH kinase family protein n=1 Tax=unclassified Sorangium TaxID=2621164 RepID=UPI003F0DB18B